MESGAKPPQNAWTLEPDEAEAVRPARPVCPIPERFILWDLPNALREFRAGGERADGGRAGMLRAVRVAISLVGSRVGEPELLEPLSALAAALTDLDNGALHPALVPRRNGRPNARQDILQFKSACLVAADVLHHSDPRRWPRQVADDDIYKRAESPAGRLGISITKKSIATWRRDARKAFGGAGNPTSPLGHWLLLTRLGLQEMRREVRDPDKQIELLLACASEVRLSHLVPR